MNNFGGMGDPVSAQIIFYKDGTMKFQYKREDGGNSWKLITTPENGFATGEGVGRIGLAVFDNNIVYAIHDNQFKRPKVAEKKTAMPEMFSVTGDVFMRV